MNTKAAKKRKAEILFQDKLFCSLRSSVPGLPPNLLTLFFLFAVSHTWPRDTEGSTACFVCHYDGLVLVFFQLARAQKKHETLRRKTAKDLVKPENLERSFGSDARLAQW